MSNSKEEHAQPTGGESEDTAPLANENEQAPPPSDEEGGTGSNSASLG